MGRTVAVRVEVDLPDEAVQLAPAVLVEGDDAHELLDVADDVIQDLRAQLEAANARAARLQADLVAEAASCRMALDGVRAVLVDASALASELLGSIAGGEPGHPGEPCHRSRWVPDRAIRKWQEREAAVRALARPPGEVTPGRAVYAVVRGVAVEEPVGRIEVHGDEQLGPLAVRVRPLLAVLEPPPF